MPFLKLLVAGFELGSSDVGCDRSANWATTVYQLNVIICLREMEEEWRQVRLLARSLEKWARRRFIILFNGLSMYSLTISTYHHPPDIKFKTDWVDSSDTGEPGGDGWQAVNSSTGGLSSWSRPHQCIAQNLGLGISYLFYSSWFDLINCTGNVINSASLVWYTSEMMNKNEVLCSNPKLVNDCYLFINVDLLKYLIECSQYVLAPILLPIDNYSKIRYSCGYIWACEWDGWYFIDWVPLLNILNVVHVDLM